MKFTAIVLATTALAQTNCTGATGNKAATFKVCIRDALTNVEGIVGATQVEAACGSAKDIQPVYFKCLCDKYTSVVSCYQNICPADVVIPTFVQSRDQFCAASQANPVTGSGNGDQTGSGNSLPPLPPLTDGTPSKTVVNSQPTSTRTAETTFRPENNQATSLGSFIGTVLVFGEVFALNLLTNFV